MNRLVYLKHILFFLLVTFSNGFVVCNNMPKVSDNLNSYSSRSIANINTKQYKMHNLRLRMSESQNIINEMHDMFEVAKPCTKQHVEINTILINIYMIQRVYLDMNGLDIRLKLTELFKNIYYITENGEVEKINNTTSIIPNKIRSILFYELDESKKVDCILYKDIDHENK